MRKKKNNMLALALCLSMIFVCLSACGSKGTNEIDAKKVDAVSAEYETHLAVILGCHDNAPLPNLGLIEDFIYKAAYTYGSVTLVCDDGDPYTVYIDIPTQEKGLSNNKYKQIANSQTKQVITAASQMVAKTGEVNTLKAIQLGARSLRSVEAETAGTRLDLQMVICDSMLSTTGVLSFSDHSLDGISSGDIVSQLRDLDEIPQLDDVIVTVYTCGDTDGKKQKFLTEANRNALKEVWKEVLEAGNADVNIKDSLPLSSVYDKENLPPVSPVAVVAPIVDIRNVEDVRDALANGGVISVPETSVAFKPGSADLMDKASAKEALRSVSAFMEEYPDVNLLVCGTTACWGGKEYCEKLSNERSNAICRLLEDEFGINKNRLTPVGVGYNSEFYIYDLTADGKLDENVAPVNRSVKLIDLNSSISRRILGMK